jgi:NAD(P)-dependent dehydrogenase (short-subunit alcohol dehydrogenase family)
MPKRPSRRSPYPLASFNSFHCFNHGGQYRHSPRSHKLLLLLKLIGLSYTTKSYSKPYLFIQGSNLTEKTVLITGASRGIGYSTAISYAAAGTSQIAIAARTSLTSTHSAILQTAKLAGHPAPKILSLALDVTSLSTIQAAAKLIKKEFGRLDILINNAGSLETYVPLVDSNPEEYKKTWDVNYIGTYLVTKTFLPLLLGTEGGLKTMVSFSSIGALRQDVGASAYEISKFAVLRFTEAVNVEYGERGVLALAVHPGGILTDMGKSLPETFHTCEFHSALLRTSGNE